MLNSALNFLLARERARDLEEAARRTRHADTSSATPVSRVTLRYASAGDSGRLRQLAALDSAKPPTGMTLVAEVDGRLRAALPLDGGQPIADPFHSGCELLELLRLRAIQLAAR